MRITQIELQGENYTERITSIPKTLYKEIYTEDQMKINTWTKKQWSNHYEGTDMKR